MRTHLAVIVLAGALVYANALAGPFLFDDQSAVVTNARIRELSLAAAFDPPRETPVAGRPLVQLSLAANYAAGGLDVTGYHVVNVGVHLLAACLLYALVRRTLERRDASPRLRAHAPAVALGSALVWVVHPLATDAVSYVTQRTELLMATALLLTLYCALRAFDAPGRPGWVAGAVLACTAGAMSKETMVVAPVLVLLYDRVFLYPSWRQAVAGRRVLYLGLAASWVVLGWLIYTAGRSTVGVGGVAAAWTYLLNQVVIVARYLRLAVWPVDLVLDYGLPRPLTPGAVLGPALVVAAFVVLTLVALWRAPRLGFLGAWVLVTLAPTSSVVPIATEVGAERRMYLPLAALAVLFVVGLVWVTTRRGTQGESGGDGAPRRSWPLAATVALAAVCVGLAAGTVLRNREYQSRLTIARTSVERWPNGRARFRLADELVAAGSHTDALAQLQQAVTDYPPAYYGLATEMMVSGRLDDAAIYAREFIRLVPESSAVPVARDLLGKALMLQGKLAEAVTEYERLVQQQPDDAGARAALADVLLRQGRLDEAVTRFGEALQRRPDDPEILQRAGLALAAAKRMDEAVEAFDRAAGAKPDDIRLLNLLGRALAAQGRYADAVGPFRRVVELAPSDMTARENLAAMERFAAGQTPGAGAAR